jgi:hypothetical protein
VKPGAYPEAHANINLSNNDETVHLLEPDALTSHKVLAGNDTRDVGSSSAKPTAPGPIGSSVIEKSKPFTADRVLVVPPLPSVAECDHLLLLSRPNQFLQLIR